MVETVSDNDFEMVLRGYHPEQVRRYIDDLASRLDAALAGLEAATGLERELAEAHAEIERLRGLTRHLPTTPSETGERIERIFTLAEEQSAEILAGAERDRAEVLARAARERAHLLATAEKEAEAIRARALADTVRARREFEAALRDRRDRERRCDELLRTLSTPENPAPSGRKATRAS
jgi:DivIVA domain-containing protein